MTNTIFRTKLSKEEQRAFTKEFKQYGITGASFSRIFFKWLNNTNNDVNPLDAFRSRHDDKDSEGTFWANFLYAFLPYKTRYYTKNETFLEIGNKLLPYIMAATKKIQHEERKQNLANNIEGLVNIEALREMFPNVIFKESYSQLQRNGERDIQYSCILKKDANNEATDYNNMISGSGHFYITGSYFKPAYIAQLVLDTVKSNLKRIHKELEQYTAQAEYSEVNVKKFIEE